MLTLSLTKPTDPQWVRGIVSPVLPVNVYSETLVIDPANHVRRVRPVRLVRHLMAGVMSKANISLFLRNIWCKLSCQDDDLFTPAFFTRAEGPTRKV